MMREAIRESRKEFLSRFEEMLHTLDDRLDDFETRLDGAGDEAMARFAAVLDALRSVRGSIETTVGQLRAAGEDAWVVFAREAERTLDRFRFDLDTARADLRADTAERRDEFGHAVKEELDAWRARLDTLELHARLGGMELREEVADGLRRFERTYQEARRRLSEARDDTTHTLDELKQGVRSAVADLRAAAESVASLVDRRSAA